jgi:hypothetical protein
MQRSEKLEGFGIAIVDHGFVYVGELEIDGKWCVVRNGHNIRRWGTTEGIGQLALDGPQPETILDKVTTIHVPIHALVHILESDRCKWTKSA